MLGGAKQFFAANKAAHADDVVKTSASNSLTKTGNCFVAGTEILTSEGEKNIEDIQVGDWVVADDPNTVGEIEYKQVLDTFVRHTDKLVDLFIDGEVISTTGEHPFWTPDKGWVEAKDLVAGSLLMTKDGRTIDIDGVENRSGDFAVYNFKVDGFHTYFVSDLGILVHNAPCPGFNPKSLQHEYKHAGDFGVNGNWNAINREIFAEAIRNHIDNAPVELTGTFRWKTPVTHYFDPATNLWAAVDANGIFVAGWKLSNQQAEDLINLGNIW
jgi:hypothetical protein